MAITAQELIDAAAFANAAYSKSGKSVWQILADLKTAGAGIPISDGWTINADTAFAGTGTGWSAQALGTSAPLGGAHQEGLIVVDTVVRTEVAGTDDQGFYRFDSLLAGGTIVQHSVAAISAVNGSTFMLAFRGSDGEGLARRYDFNDAINDPEGHYAELEQLISDVVHYVKTHSEITKLVVTGHSLGGEMAQLFAERMSQLSVSDGLNPSMVDIITFGSPGLPTENGVNLATSVHPAWQDRIINFGHTEDIIFKDLANVLTVGNSFEPQRTRRHRLQY